MKQWKALIAGALLCGLAAVAWSDNNVGNHGTYYYNQATGQKTDSQGNALITNAFVPADQNLTFPNIINNVAGLVLATADSSAILDTHTMRLGMLLIKGFPGSANAGTTDTTTVWRVAVQIRTHLNGQADSSSTFAIYNYGEVPLMNDATPTAGKPDSSAQGHLQDGIPLTGITATPSATTSWSGEFVVVISGKRFAHAGGFAINGHTFYYPSGIAIPISSLFGRDVFSPYTSVRVRILTCQKGAASAGATPALGLSVSLVGTPL